MVLLKFNGGEVDRESKSIGDKRGNMWKYVTMK